MIKGIRSILALTILVLLSFGFARAQDAVYLRGANIPFARAIVVDVTKPWTDTGVHLQAGDRMTIIAKGIASTGSSEPTLWAGPEGIHLQNSQIILPSANLWSLIGKI